MALLKDILYKVNLRSVSGDTGIDVSGVQSDSRKVAGGILFIAIKGLKSDGHDYIDIAIEKGAIAIVCQQMPSTIHEGITYIQVADPALAAGLIAHNFYESPSAKLKITGVTGTNGKTTVATLLYKLFTVLGYKCGLVSTVENRIGEKLLPAEFTTPDAITLNALLKQMADEGCLYVFMETSSHALHQHRLAGIHFTGAIFTNITHDHLDYHQTFEEYIRVKKSFFDGLSADAFAITNMDDKRGLVMLQNTIAKKYSYSLKTMAHFKGRILENVLTGLVMHINEQEVHFRLIGEFNAYNLLAVYGAAICLGQDKDDVLRYLSMLTGAEGRFDYIISPKEKIIGIVDYAHTPDALLNVLHTIKKLCKGDEQVLTVVGCGGDRDKSKRPVMAEVACAHSHRVILTSDNPRTEDPLQIIADMETGINTAGKRKYIAIPDRREAIKTAVSLAGKEDIVLIAGKGHEKYQEINGVRNHFDDKETLVEMFGILEK